jgi:hypothetical protein
MSVAESGHNARRLLSESTITISHLLGPTSCFGSDSRVSESRRCPPTRRRGSKTTPADHLDLRPDDDQLIRDAVGGDAKTTLQEIREMVCA